MLGMNQTILFGIAMLVVAALVGTRELGRSIYNALTNADAGKGLSPVRAWRSSPWSPTASRKPGPRGARKRSGSRSAPSRLPAGKSRTERTRLARVAASPVTVHAQITPTIERRRS